MEGYKKEFDKGTGRKRNNEYSRKQSYRQRCKAKIRKEWDGYSDTENQEAVRQLAELKRAFQKISMGDPMDTGYKRIQYVRYADDFLIGVIGSKEDAEKIKYDIGRFFEETLKLELSAEKTLITNSDDKARFLGCDVTVCNDNELKKAKVKGNVKACTGKIKLYLPKEKWVGKLLNHGVLKIVSRAGERLYFSASA